MIRAALKTPRALVFLILCTAFLSACGGGGGGSSNVAATPAPDPSPSPDPNPDPAPDPDPVTPPASDFDQGIFSPAAEYEALCLNPRGSGFPDEAGTTEDENNWLRAWSHDLYLWYNEIVDEDPAGYSTPDYFELMKTFAQNPSGSPKDNFHFTLDTEEWELLSQSGLSVGYGAEFILLTAAPPREIVVGFVESGSPAAAAGVERGARVISIDGADAVEGGTQADVDALNAGLFPDSDGEVHVFEIEDFDGANRRTVNLTSAEITLDPVPVTAVGAQLQSSDDTAYLLFNSHIATAEQRLFTEIENLAASNIQNLILDLRYNGGGFLDIANQLAYMIAGPNATQNTVFGETLFNDKHPNVDPVTGRSLQPEPFHNTTLGFSLASGTDLPSLSLPRVFVLSTADTCSASESVMNALRGIGIEVILIGEPTCGKPFGFYPADNCGTTYFSIQFQAVNNLGFGDYADGFVPTSTPIMAHEVEGCSVADDFSFPLGDPQEALLATALGYIDTGDCSAAPVTAAPLGTMKASVLQPADARLSRSQGMPGMVK